MDNIDFPSLPDAEAARLMAERDGWRVVKDGAGWTVYASGSSHPSLFTTDESEVNEWILAGLFTCYPDSLDAGVGWLARMGLIWQRKAECHDKYWVDVFWGAGGVHCAESATCPTSRAMCNAGWLAVKAREAANG